MATSLKGCLSTIDKVFAQIKQARLVDGTARRSDDRTHPPLIMSESDIGEIMDKVGASIKAAA
jgi:hypothetical protein